MPPNTKAAQEANYIRMQIGLYRSSARAIEARGAARHRIALMSPLWGISSAYRSKVKRSRYNATARAKSHWRTVDDLTRRLHVLEAVDYTPASSALAEGLASLGIF